MFRAGERTEAVCSLTLALLCVDVRWVARITLGVVGAAELPEENQGEEVSALACEPCPVTGLSADSDKAAKLKGGTPSHSCWSRGGNSDNDGGPDLGGMTGTRKKTAHPFYPLTG